MRDDRCALEHLDDEALIDRRAPCRRPEVAIECEVARKRSRRSAIEQLRHGKILPDARRSALDQPGDAVGQHDIVQARLRRRLAANGGGPQHAAGTGRRNRRRVDRVRFAPLARRNAPDDQSSRSLNHRFLTKRDKHRNRNYNPIGYAVKMNCIHYGSNRQQPARFESAMIKALPNRIRAFRERAGLSMQALAERAGTSAPQINKLEKGDRKLTVDWMIRLGRALGADPKDLMIIEPQEGPPFEPVGTG